MSLWVWLIIFLYYTFFFQINVFPYSIFIDKPNAHSALLLQYLVSASRICSWCQYFKFTIFIFLASPGLHGDTSIDNNLMQMLFSQSHVSGKINFEIVCQAQRFIVSITWSNMTFQHQHLESDGARPGPIALHIAESMML
jgi:hypothetical protein